MKRFLFGKIPLNPPLKKGGSSQQGKQDEKNKKISFFIPLFSKGDKRQARKQRGILFKNFAGFRLNYWQNQGWKRLSVKNKGMVILLPTIILSGLILAVGLGLSRVLMTELEFSADLLFSEKAYFAAESGVEKSLLALKDKPLNYVIESDKEVGTGATYDLEIANSVEKFPFVLDKNETIKFRLGVDENENFAGYSVRPITNFEINLDLNGREQKENLHWKILCLVDNGGNHAKKTVALSGTGNDFTKGNYDDGDRISLDTRVVDFLSQNNSNQNPCFMSLSNFSEIDEGNLNRTNTMLALQDTDSEIRGIFKPIIPETIAPAKVKITATGKSFSREKIVSFDYWQKNLSAVYDLGLYYTKDLTE